MIDHLSFSSVSKYMRCHRQWKYKYIDGLEEETNDNFTFGKAWHKTLQNTLTQNLTIQESWAYANNNESEKLPEDLYKLGEYMALRGETYDVIQSLNLMPESIEKKIELHIPGVEIPVIGYIDMIEHGTNIPIDFKTAGRKWSLANEKNDFIGDAEKKMQATFYIAALEQAGMITLPHAFRYIVFTKTSKPAVQIIDTVRTAYDIMELHEIVRDVWRSIQSGNFGKCDPDNWHCSPKYCSFWNRCKNGK